MQQSVNNCNTATTYILYFWIHLFIMSHPQLSSLLLLFIAVRRSWQDIAVSCLIRLFLMKREHLFVFRPDSLDIVTELKLLLYYCLLNKFSPLLLGILMIFRLRSISEGILHYVRSFWVPRMVGHPETTTSQMLQFLFQAHLFLLIRKLPNNTILQAAPPQTTTICNVLELLMFERCQVHYFFSLLVWY